MKYRAALALFLFLPFLLLARLSFAGPTADSLTFLPFIAGDAAEPPSPTPSPTATTPAPPAGCAICHYDAYNCGDFQKQKDAQACFNYCMAQVGYDVHNLDGDDDGIACEDLPLTFGGWRFRWP